MILAIRGPLPRRLAAELTRLRREAHDRVQMVLNSMTDGLLLLDKKWCYTHVSQQAARLLGMRAEDLLGQCVGDLFPHAKGTKFYEGYHRAVQSRDPVHFGEYYPEPVCQWLAKAFSEPRESSKRAAWRQTCKKMSCVASSASEKVLDNRRAILKTSGLGINCFIQCPRISGEKSTYRCCSDR